MKARHYKLVPPTDPNQMIIAGVEPLSLVERLAWTAQQPLQPKRAQHPLNIGSGTPCANSWKCFKKRRPNGRFPVQKFDPSILRERRSLTVQPAFPTMLALRRLCDSA